MDIDDKDSGGSIRLDDGFVGGAAFGQRFGAFRIESEVDYRHHNINESHFSGRSTALSAMLNFYGDIEITERIDWYVGAGVGASLIQIDGRGQDFFGQWSLKENDLVFAYQGRTGVAVHVTERLVIDTGYRLWSSTDPNFDGVRMDMPFFHTIEVGARFRF